MTLNASVEFHMRFVTQKHNELKGSLKQLVNILVSENLEEKKTQAKKSLDMSNDLRAAISDQDCPSWLNSLIDALKQFIGGRSNQNGLITHLITNLSQINNHKWAFDAQAEKSFDFDSIFEHYKAQSRIPELFDKIIEILEEIQSSGEVDSVSMMTALGKVIATLKKNKDGSYFSLNSAWAFLISFLKNYMWGELSKIPVLGTAMEALEKTIKETNEEMFKVHSSVQSEMKKTVESEVKGLKQKTNFDFVGYDKSGNSLPQIESSSTIIQDV